MTASADLSRYAVTVRRLTRSEFDAAGRAVQTIARQEARRAAGGDERLDAGVRRPIRLTTRRTRRVPVGGPYFSTVFARPAGPWQWITDGTDPHTIRRRRRGPLARVTVDHPGAAGKRAWLRVVARAERVVPTLFADALDRIR